MRAARIMAGTLTLAVGADWRAAVLIGVIVMLQSTSVAAVALAQRWVVDTSGHGVGIGLIAAALLGALAHAAGAAGNRIQGSLRLDLGERADVVLSQQVLAAAARIPTVEHLDRPEYLDRLLLVRRGTRDLAASCWSVAEVAASLTSLALSIWLLVSVHPALALLAALGAAPLLFARRSRTLIRHALDASAATLRHSRRLHELCIDPGAAKEVWIAATGPELSRRAQRLWESTTHREVVARACAAAWQLAGWTVYAVGFGAAMAIAASRIASGAATLGDLVLIVSLATRLRGQIAVTVAGLNRVAEAGHVADHYLWLQEHAAGYSGRGGASIDRLTTGISLDRVGFCYPDAEKAALSDVSLQLRPGSVVAVVGANGAGKSTLVKLLTGMYRCTRGEILIDGRPLSELDPGSWSAQLSGTFQDFVELHCRVRESVGAGDLSRIDDGTAVRAATDRAGVSEMVSMLPDGVETQVGRTFDGVDLSHGEWQGLAVARGMMRDRPLLLVLDEPTAAIDPQAEHALLQRLMERARAVATEHGTITVLVSHRCFGVQQADHIVVLANGLVAEQGTHAELMERDRTYADMYRLQARGYA